MREDWFNPLKLHFESSLKSCQEILTKNWASLAGLVKEPIQKSLYAWRISV